MNHIISYWLLLIASVWMSLTVTVLEGVRPIPNQQSLEVHGHGNATTGKKWAILVAGSNEYENYRHQADICHAYQILKKGGLKDENIVVFMYDDIAFNPQNPRPGIIINKPNGPNVYEGVPKDYIGDDAHADNFFAALSGNRSAVTGGSGKVVESGPNDIIFIYYADHGSAGLVSMPVGGFVAAEDLVEALKKKHAAKSYKKMVIYMEACESGSMFEGLLPDDINIYVTTASSASENSYAFYCPRSNPAPPPEYTTCLGDLYSISWLEDSDKNDMTKETLQQQYETVRRRTLTGSVDGTSSQVMQYGDTKFKNDFLVTYIGADPANVHKTYNLTTSIANSYISEPSTTPTKLLNQQDAHLLHLSLKLEKALDDSDEKLEAQKALEVELAHRERVDNSVHLIGDLLFGKESSSTKMFHVRPAGQPLVDDWDCFKALMKTYENHCGNLSTYGRKYTRVFANMCNAGISKEQMVAAASQACL